MAIEMAAGGSKCNAFFPDTDSEAL